jgi:phosphoenolpyruvate-protein kinase (PTS system EI component)
MSERILRGIAASPGIGAGPVHLLDPRPTEDGSTVALSERPAAVEAAESALENAAAQVTAVAERLRMDGREDEAEIVDTGAMLATDPTLRDSVRDRILDEGQGAAGAIIDAADELAKKLANLDDAMLAARADDVRSVGSRAALIAAGRRQEASPEGGWPESILVASDLGPADVAELSPRVSGLALAGGGVTAHAAIVARSLGIPMVVGLGEGLLAITEDEPAVIDGSEGEFILSPSLARVAHARLAGEARQRSRSAAASRRELPAVTTDGHEVRVLANVAGPAEVRVALEAGAEGIGLLRTELSFLDIRSWPDRRDHERALRPALGALGNRVATVRLLDFGGDKSPPFLRGRSERGIKLQLSDPGALDAQLEALLDAGGASDLRVLVPMVEEADQMRSVRDALARAAEAVPGAQQPPLGAMVETAEAVDRVTLIAEESDFLSIGTNDLSASILGRDRFKDGGVSATDPVVLRAIEVVARAGDDAGLTVELCGEAASDPSLLPLLIGFGVNELSVGAARVGEVRAWVRALSHLDCAALARRTLRAKSQADVLALTANLAGQLGSAEFRDTAGERVDGSGSVVSLGSDN